MVLGALPLLPLGGLVWLWGCLRPLYHTAIHQAVDDEGLSSLSPHPRLYGESL
jgi:hypothetical protein